MSLYGCVQLYLVQIPYDPMSVYMCLCVYLYLYRYSYLCLVSSKALGFEEPEYVLVSVYCYCTTPTTTSRSTTAAITTTTAVTILREARQSGRRDDTGGIGGSSVRWSGGPVTPRVGVAARPSSRRCPAKDDDLISATSRHSLPHSAVMLLTSAFRELCFRFP